MCSLRQFEHLWKKCLTINARKKESFHLNFHIRKKYK